MPNTLVFFDLSINSEPAGRFVFELYSMECPLTADNFKCLCTGEKGMGRRGKPLHYKGSILHRIIKGFMVQGGDFTHGSGIGGESIYGLTFADENFSYKHSKRGMLSMANAGPDTNGSQFFIIFRPTPHLDGKHVVFGELVQGMPLLDRIEKILVRSEDRPKYDVVIEDCGLVVDSEVMPADPVAEMASLPKAFGSTTKKSWISRHTAIVAAPEIPKADLERKKKFEKIKELIETQKPIVQDVPDVLPPEATPREKQLFELRLKMNEARKANVREVQDERKRFADPNATKKIAREEDSEMDREKKRKETGVDAKTLHLLNQTAEQAEKEYLKTSKDGKIVFNPITADHYSFEKNSKLVPLNGKHVYKDSGFVDINSLEYGRDSVVPPANVDVMAKEVTDLIAKRITDRKRPKFYADADVTSINDSNRMFNHKIEKFYGKYTADIKAALERGSA